MVLAGWQIGNDGACKKLSLLFFPSLCAAVGHNWSTGKGVCQLERLPWHMADGVIKSWEAQPKPQDSCRQGIQPWITVALSVTCWATSATGLPAGLHQLLGHRLGYISYWATGWATSATGLPAGLHQFVLHLKDRCGLLRVCWDAILVDNITEKCESLLVEFAYLSVECQPGCLNLS